MQRRTLFGIWERMTRSVHRGGLGKALKTGAMLFAGASVAVATAGQIVAWKRDKHKKPSLDQIVDVTSAQAQEVLEQAAYGTDVKLNPVQRQPIPGVNDTYRYHVVKRGFDVVFSACASVACFIPTLAVCALIWLDEPGSPIYKQKRVGRYGVPINIYKLRSMVVGADDVEKHLTPEQLKQWETEHKVDNDPRITKIGKFLRKTSLDELPQFWNVLTGEMSVIGPRPVEPDELVAYDDSVVEFLSMTPGITGWWQTMSRNDAKYEDGERQELELFYVRNRSAKIDIRIFFETFRAMFGKNASGK